MSKSLEHIQCVFLTSKDIDRAIEFGRQYFLNDEPLCHSMNLKVSPGCDYYLRYALEQGTSVMAIDTSQGNKIVGVRGHRVCRRGETVHYDPPEDELWGRVLALGEFAYQQVDPWNRYDVDVMLEAKLLAVHKDYRGMNIGVHMMDFTFDFMRREKIPLFYLWATSEYTKIVVKKVGFELVHEMKYEDYKVDGKQVFYPEKIHSGYGIYIKWVK